MIALHFPSGLRKKTIFCNCQEPNLFPTPVNHVFCEWVCDWNAPIKREFIMKRYREHAAALKKKKKKMKSTFKTHFPKESCLASSWNWKMDSLIETQESKRNCQYRQTLSVRSLFGNIRAVGFFLGQYRREDIVYQRQPFCVHKPFAALWIIKLKRSVRLTVINSVWFYLWVCIGKCSSLVAYVVI